MDRRTWAHRATLPLVRRLAGTGITPNHLTALRLGTGLLAVASLARGASVAGGAWFLVSAFLDRADGELARLTGASSPAGHYFDLASDLAVTSLLFVGIGYGLRSHPLLGPWALPLGIAAGVSVAAIFCVVTAMEAGGRPALPGAGGFDADDILFLVPPLAWVGWLPQLLVAAAAGAPLFLLLLAGRRRRSARSAAPRTGRGAGRK